MFALIWLERKSYFLHTIQTLLPSRLWYFYVIYYIVNNSKYEELCTVSIIQNSFFYHKKSNKLIFQCVVIYRYSVRSIWDFFFIGIIWNVIYLYSLSLIYENYSTQFNLYIFSCLHISYSCYHTFTYSLFWFTVPKY